MGFSRGASATRQASTAPTSEVDRNERLDGVSLESENPLNLDFVEGEMTMRWTCPKCKARNATIIAFDAEAGKIVEAWCPACGTQHEASVFFPPAKAGASMPVGVVWI